MRHTNTNLNLTLFVVVEVFQELEQLVLVATKDGFDLWRLLWVRDKHLHSNPINAHTMRSH